MKVFECDHCGNLLFFENVSCLRCHHTLGFVPDILDLCTFAQDGPLWQPLTTALADRRFRQCSNGAHHQVCNWLIPDEDKDPLCRACRLNLVIPDLNFPGNLQAWQKLEIAKRRVIYSLLRFHLPTEQEQSRPPLRFQFVAEPPGGPPVLTGHLEGIITVNIVEADDAERERRRLQFHEPFRTLLGHLRHEIAHYYWDRLVFDSHRIVPFRRLFGDERIDYQQSLQRHYELGPSPNWQETHLSAYATSHPWEDWAETWAHYFHITDTLETAGSFGVTLNPRHPQAKTMRAEPTNVASGYSQFDEMMRHWLPLTYALNELNRGMGLPDLYPFVLSTPALEKLRFVHELLRENS